MLFDFESYLNFLTACYVICRYELGEGRNPIPTPKIVKWAWVLIGIAFFGVSDLGDHSIVAAMFFHSSKYIDQASFRSQGYNGTYQCECDHHQF